MACASAPIPVRLVTAVLACGLLVACKADPIPPIPMQTATSTTSVASPTTAPSAEPEAATDAGTRESCYAVCTDEFKACIVAIGGFDRQKASDCGGAHSRCRDRCRQLSEPDDRGR